MSGDDPRRRYTRRAIGALFVLRDQDNTQAGELAFEAIDISEGGAFLRSDLLLDIGEQLEVRFTLPESEGEHVVMARVAWVTKERDSTGAAGMGLSFRDLKPSTAEAIARFVRAER